MAGRSYHIFLAEKMIVRRPACNPASPCMLAKVAMVQALIITNSILNRLAARSA